MRVFFFVLNCNHDDAVRRLSNEAYPGSLAIPKKALVRPQECPETGTQEKLAGQKKEAPDAQRKPARGPFFSCVFGFLCVGFLKENYKNETTHRKKSGSVCAFAWPPVRLFSVLQTFPVCRSLVILGASSGPSGDLWRPHRF